MRIGLVGDLHEPFTYPTYRRFCQDIFDRYDVNHVHFAGDIVDNHALSFHEHDPNLHSANDEAMQARRSLKRWVRAFPNATVSIGNHDALHFRKARNAGISDNFLKAYKDVWATPGWKWDFEFVIDDTLLTHGTGCSGANAALQLAITRRKSVAIGHIHSNAGYNYQANTDDRIFGLNVSCGIDVPALAFAYGINFKQRPVLGCAVIDDGEPLYFGMPIGRGEKYNRRRFGKRKRRVLV